MYIMCVCLFSALSCRVGALQISIIIIIFHYYYYCVAHPQVVCNCARAEGMSQNVTACSISAREKHMAQPSLQSSQHRLVKRLTERSNKTVNSLI